MEPSQRITRRIPFLSAASVIPIGQLAQEPLAVIAFTSPPRISNGLPSSLRYWQLHRARSVIAQTGNPFHSVT